MKSAIPVFMAALFLMVTAAGAEQRTTLGWGMSAVNDAFGDGADRWRTGSVMVSKVNGLSWSGSLPVVPGEIIELRAAAEVIAPVSLTHANVRDRRYAGVLTFGLHTYFDLQGWDARVGGDVVLIGPQTGLSSVQKSLHRIMAMPEPRVAADQIGNRVKPTLSAEIARDMSLTDAVRLRPFVEMQIGVETYLRTGGDLTLGRFGTGTLMPRETVTGHRYRAVGSAAPATGFSLVLGADITRVFASTLLPSDGMAEALPTRQRLRAGVHWQGARAEAFYGVSALGREFSAQREGQVVGMLSARFPF